MPVRAAFVAVAVAVGGLFVVGCSQPVSPTSNGLASLGSSVGPIAVTNHDLPPDEVEDPGPNPWTGALTTLTIHFVKFVERLETDASGAQHHTVGGVAELSTSDGFSGKATFHFTGYADGLEVDHEVNSLVLDNDSGQTIVARFLRQEVREDGNIHVDFEVEFVECRGKPIV